MRAVIAALALPVADAASRWYMAHSNQDCEETCFAAGKTTGQIPFTGQTCVPAKLPDSATLMSTVAEEAHFVCENIKRVEASSDVEKFAPFFIPFQELTATQASQAGHLKVGTCYYPHAAQHSECKEEESVRNTPQKKLLQRFCMCSDVGGLDWLVSNPGDSCDKTCEANRGLCANTGNPGWPANAHDMSAVLAKIGSGVNCRSVGFGETDAAPSMDVDGKCQWARSSGSGDLPKCSTSEQNKRRFCPCYDIERPQAV